ncbi:hypothetical protein PIB30_029656 [Stylosanthes scabra]|uniref:F-box domain-containing protein n=1 Tax=Stylosanthes scabra TaxID=79078 RepID=A0ABU6SBU1_9FABA|nr:hypothetical protein [Stylosanthes scabra]
MDRHEAQEEEEEELIPSLPWDVALNCLARVPRSHHGALSLVSKPIRSLLLSPIFYATRSALNCTQPVIYITLRNSQSELWFSLPLNSSAPLSPSPIPPPPVPFPGFHRGHTYALLGHDIYVMGGFSRSGDPPSKEVWILDCRFNRWRQGPTMRYYRRDAVAAVLDGKIYVMGGINVFRRPRCHNLPSSNWGEVLDPAVGIWEEISRPADANSRIPVSDCKVVADKLYVGCGEVIGRTMQWWEYHRSRGRVWKRVNLPRMLWSGSIIRRRIVDDDGDEEFQDLQWCEGRIQWVEAKEQGIWNTKDVNGSWLNILLPKTLAKVAALVATASGELFLVCVHKRRQEAEFDYYTGCSRIEINKTTNESGELRLHATSCWFQSVHCFNYSSSYYKL